MEERAWKQCFVCPSQATALAHSCADCYRKQNVTALANQLLETSQAMEHKGLIKEHEVGTRYEGFRWLGPIGKSMPLTKPLPINER